MKISRSVAACRLKKPRQVSKIYIKLIRLAENRKPDRRTITWNPRHGCDRFSGALEQGCDVDDAS